MNIGAGGRARRVARTVGRRARDVFAVAFVALAVRIDQAGVIPSRCVDVLLSSDVDGIAVTGAGLCGLLWVEEAIFLSLLGGVAAVAAVALGRRARLRWSA